MADGVEEFVLSPARFYVMGVYFLACVVQGLTWTPLSALPDESARVFPGLSNATIFWSLNLGPILYIPLAPFAAWLLTAHLGMQRTVRLGLLCSVLAATLRLGVSLCGAEYRASGGASALLLLAGAFVGLAAPFTQGSAARFSAIWFPPSERARATAVSYLGTYFGSALSYVLSPGVVATPSCSVAGGEPSGGAAGCLLQTVTDSIGSADDCCGPCLDFGAGCMGFNYTAAAAGATPSCALLGPGSRAQFTVQDAALLGQFRKLLWVEAVMCWLPFALALLYFPDAPGAAVRRHEGGGKSGERAGTTLLLGDSNYDSSGGRTCARSDADALTAVEGKEMSFRESCHAVLANPSFMLLTVSCGFIQGFYSSWGASLAIVLGPLGFSSSQADLLAFVGTLT